MCVCVCVCVCVWNLCQIYELGTHRKDFPFNISNVSDLLKKTLVAFFLASSNQDFF